MQIENKICKKKKKSCQLVKLKRQQSVISIDHVTTVTVLVKLSIAYSESIDQQISEEHNMQKSVEVSRGLW